jgi:hypothetical protein
MTYSINITAESVAWYAAIVATISVIFSGINLWLDRSKIKISHSKSWVPNVPGYDPNELYFDIQVRNVGRRTVPLGNVGIKLFDGSALLLAAGFDKRINKILTEQNPRTNFLTPVKEIDFTKAHYIVIYDEKGKEYRKYFSHIPTFKKLIWRIKKK